MEHEPLLPAAPEARDQAWSFLAPLAADVALLRETEQPPVPGVWRPVTGAPWGSAVVSSTLELTEIPRSGLQDSVPKGTLAESHPGASVVAEAEIMPGRKVTFVRISGLIRKGGLSDTGYATTTVHRTLSDLTPVLDVHRSKRTLVLGGDMNVTPEIPFPGAEMHAATIERLKAFRLVDCLGAKQDGFVRTIRHRNNPASTPYQDDWIFASPDLSIVACDPVDDKSAWALSDHCPVIPDCEI